MKKYDVLILCQFFYPEHVSTATLPYEMAEDLVKKGLTVRVVCGYPNRNDDKGKLPKRENINGIEIRRLNYTQLPKASKIGRLINYFSFMIAVILRWRLLINNKCIIVYSNPPVLPLITAINKKLFKVKYIFVSYDIYPDIALVTKQIKENSFIHRMMSRVNRQMDKTVDKVISLSNDMKDYILKTRKSISADRIEVIPNWYDNNDMDAHGSDDIINNELILLKEKYSLIILYSGNMGIAQDMETILKTAKYMKRNKDVLFIFAGNGQKADKIKEEINESKLSNVRFYDYLLGQDYINILKISDVHIISLVDGITGMAVPSKTYSYMSIGRPLIAIIAENTDIAKDINNYKLGCTLNTNDVDKFANYISYLEENKSEVVKIGNRVVEVFNKKYTRKISTTKYYELIKELIE